MVDILGNTRNVISQIIRGDNRGRADLQRGGQAGVSRLKFPLKDREPRWQGSTTFSDSCLFMIFNLVNPFFHCNSQYSWYKGLKAIGVTGRRKMDKDISGALISVQCLQPDVSKWPQKRLSLWDQLSKLCSTCFGSYVLIFGTRKLREWWIWFQVTRHDITRCHQVTTRLAQACQPLVYNRAGGRDTNLIKIISPQQNTSYTSMEVLEPPVTILRKRTQYSSSWKSLKIQREMIWTLAKDRHWGDGTAIMACKDWRLMRRALNAARDSIKPIWSAALQRCSKENKRRHSKRNDSAGL